MKLPSIKNHTNSLDYFTQFYQINKSHKKTFSFRSFANKVKWPSSYLSDILKGRKKLTISRCLQFAKTFKFTNVETEYLLTLCLADYPDTSVSTYFKASLEDKNLTKEKKSSFKNYLNFFDDIRSMYLRELILWGQGKVALTELLKAQIPFPELQQKKVLDETLIYLKKNNLIREIKPDYYVVVENELFALDDNEFTASTPEHLANHYIHQLEILGRLYKKYTGVGFSFSGYLDITKDRYPEVQKRMFELRDWLISLSKEKKSESLQENDTFQLEMHFIPMFGLDKLNLSSK